jgi:hypothetical protein
MIKLLLFIVLAIDLCSCKFGVSMYYNLNYSTATLKCAKESGYDNAMYTVGVNNQIP